MGPLGHKENVCVKVHGSVTVWEKVWEKMPEHPCPHLCMSHLHVQVTITACVLLSVRVSAVSVRLSEGL